MRYLVKNRDDIFCRPKFSFRMKGIKFGDPLSFWRRLKKSEQRINGGERELIFNPDHQISVESHSSLEVHLTQGGSLTSISFYTIWSI